MESKLISVVSKLQEQEDASKFIQNSNDVLLYYAVEYSKLENFLNFARGKIFTERDYADFAKQNKKPIALLWQKDSQRAFLGAMVQNRFSASFQPFDVKNEKSVKMAENLKYRYMRDAEALEFAEKDKRLISDFWATGRAYQELYAELSPGDRPQYFLNNENVLGIYWDPNSRDLGRRSDAQFVERRKYVSLEDLQLNFEDEDFCDLETSMSDSYTAVNKVADRGHETELSRNGLFMVIERFYKVTEREYYKLDEYNKKTPISEEEAKATKLANKEAQKKGGPKAGYIGRSEKEYMYLAIACPSWSGTKFLFNGKCRLQPRSDRNSNKVLWPILECIAEAVGGEAVGFAEALVDPVKIASGIMTQQYHIIRHAASTAKVFKPDHFKSPTIAKDFEKNSADPTKRFAVKVDAPLADIEKNVETGRMSPDALDMLQTVLGYIEKASSTPPALKGQQESATTAASLNQARIDQSFIQLAECLSNYRNFIRRRAEYLRALDVELNDSFINEEVNITQKQKVEDPDQVTLNEVDEEMDEMGNPTGNVYLKNNAGEDDFKVQITDAYDSPLKSDAMKTVLQDLMNMPAIQGDQGALMAIAVELVQLSDMPLDVKDRIMKASNYSQQEQAKQQAMEQQGQQIEQEGQALDNEGKKVQIAQSQMMPIMEGEPQE